jgi:hypothetical protein
VSAALGQKEVAAAFPDDDITVVAANTLPAGLTDLVSRRVLVEVGFPEDVVGCLFFEGVEEPLQTLKEFRKNDPVQAEAAADYVVAFNYRHAICLEGRTGECRFVDTAMGAPTHAATDLEVLLAFLCQLQIALLGLSLATPEEELDRAEDRLVERFRSVDSEIDETEWRWLIRYCTGEVIR